MDRDLPGPTARTVFSAERPRALPAGSAPPDTPTLLADVPANVRIRRRAAGPAEDAVSRHDPTNSGTGSDPISRQTKRDDIAETVVFLTSPAAAGITGQVIPVTGWGL